jgi:hypothetical protein
VQWPHAATASQEAQATDSLPVQSQVALRPDARVVGAVCRHTECDVPSVTQYCDRPTWTFES